MRFQVKILKTTHFLSRESLLNHILNHSVVYKNNLATDSVGYV